MHFRPLISSCHLSNCQLRMERQTISINLVTESDDAVEEFEKLRDERDRLIHIAQVEEFACLQSRKLCQLRN